MTRKPGRNDPCPCGSGKKYKKCCGRESPPSDRTILPDDQRTGTPMDDYFVLLPFLAIHEQKIIQFDPDGPELKKARKNYEKRYRPGKDGGLMDSHYMSWLYFDLRFGKSRRTIVERVLDDPLTAKLSEPGPTCLRHMAASYATFYEVIDDGPDVLFLDVRLPGMDGLEVLRRLRQDWVRRGALRSWVAPR
jgi:CheY-like chemotaxis protein